jgi:GDP-4-dehydro-6-deoxy-D-mannose reductase
MRVLVTGGTGFVGQHLVRLLHERTRTIFSTYLVKPSSPIIGAELLPCDIRKRDQVLQVVRYAQPQHIYHLSALSSVVKSYEGARQVWDTNVWGAMNLLDAVREAAPQARVLLVGSSQCYGAVASRRLPVSEDERLAPASPYAASKAAAEMLATQFFHSCGLQVIRTRPFNHTGPGQPAEFVCSDLARQVANIGLGLRSPVLRIGNIRVERDFSDVRDVVRAYELLLQRGGAGDVYNVASGRSVSIAEIVKRLQSYCPRPFQVDVEQKRVRSGEVLNMYGSNRKLCRTTGWKPEYPLAQTLRDLYEFWKIAATTEHDESAHELDTRER